MAKKMYLVDPQSLSSTPHPSKHQNVPNATIDNIFKLDEDMKSILHNKNEGVTLYEKVQKYNQVLEKYLRFYEDFKDNKSTGVVNSTPEVLTPPSSVGPGSLIDSINPSAPTPSPKGDLMSDLHTDTIQSLSSSHRPKAKRVLNYLKNIPTLKWSDKGEMILDGQLFTNSHIVDLVGGVIKQNLKTKPKGFEEFKLLLKIHNLPSQLVNFKTTPPLKPKLPPPHHRLKDTNGLK